MIPWDVAYKMPWTTFPTWYSGVVVIISALVLNLFLTVMGRKATTNVTVNDYNTATLINRLTFAMTSSS